MSARLRYLRYRDLDGLARDRLDHMKSDLSNGNLDGPFPSFTFLGISLTNHISVAGQDSLAVNSPRVLVTGTLSVGISAGTIFWLGDAGLNLYSFHTNSVDASAATNEITIADAGAMNGTIIILN